MKRRIRASLVAVVGLLALASGSAAAQTPRYIVYYNSGATPLAKVGAADYTHVMLSFLTVAEDGGDAPLALVTPAPLGGQLADVAALKQGGKTVMASFGGGAMSAASWARLAGREMEIARLLAGFVVQHGLDGVGIDFEISEALHRNPKHRAFDGRGLLIALTKALRAALPAGSLISHAPQPPYLDPRWENGPYLEILRAVGPDIDWIAVQYYNNRGYDGPASVHVLGAARAPFVTSIAGLAEGMAGIKWPPEKTVVGKPIYRDDASSGHLPPARVREEIVKPLVARYGNRFGGLMGWQFSDLTDDHRYWNRRMAPGLLQAGR
ncbi:MAG: glycoside hydrolase family 18 protein [Thalassobaculaceae bacterium]|nr:glycoside hydrolase family 18 protein [Thalassobaculaceae bacterium]